MSLDFESNVSYFLWIFLYFVVTLTTIYVWKNRYFYYYASKIPGPFSLPMLGSAHLFIGKKDYFQVLANTIKSYPSVSKMWLGPFLVIFTSRPRDVEFVLSNFLEKGLLYHFLKDQTRNALISAPVTMWKKNRKLINHTFNRKAVNSSVECFVKYSEKIVDVLGATCGKEENDLITKFWNSTLAIAVESLADADPDCFDFERRFIPSIERNSRIIFKRFHSFWLYLDPLWKMSALAEESRSITDTETDFLRQEVVEKKLKTQSLTEPTKELFLNYILDKKEQISLDQATEELKFMLIAASETSAFTLTLFVLVLGLHPEVQEKIYEEVIFVSGEGNSLTLAGINRMKYLERVLKETMRLFPIVPFLTRSIDKDIELDPFVFPAGSEICLPIIHIHRNPEFWPDPLKFNPDRFLPEEVKKRHRCAFIPFSFGPRNCIGYKYAMLEIKCVAAEIVRNFKIKSGKCKSLEEIEFDFNFMVKPKNYSVMFERRET